MPRYEEDPCDDYKQSTSCPAFHMHSIFPLEIEETVLNLLADEDDQGHSALKTCSLVCQAFLPICRKHIFGSIVLNDYTIRTLERLLHDT